MSYFWLQKWIAAEICLYFSLLMTTALTILPPSLPSVAITFSWLFPMPGKHRRTFHCIFLLLMLAAEKSASFMASFTLRDWCNIIFFTARFSLSDSVDTVVDIMVERLSLMLDSKGLHREKILLLLEKWHGLECAAPQTGSMEVGIFDEEDVN